MSNPPEAAPGLQAGGFSGVVHIPGDPSNIFYAVNDRGPHSTVVVNGVTRRTLPFPDLTPSIWKLKINGHKMEILERITIKRPDGTPVTGLPNLQGRDETPYDGTGQNRLPFDPHGLDLEGIGYDPVDDTFWLCDEYRTLVHVDRNGVILDRLVPSGVAGLLNTGYARDALSAYFTKMPSNRGFEGLTVTPGGEYVIGAAQTPINNPSAAVGNNSLNTRIVVVDLRSGEQAAEYVFVREKASDYPGVLQVDVNIGDVHALSTSRMIVVERDKNFGAAARLKKIFIADMSQATNVKGIETVGGVTLESMTPAQLVAAGIQPMTKELLVDILVEVPDLAQEKVEGVTMVNDKKLMFCIDNDYALEGAMLPPECHELHFKKPIK
jgi:hypothetical protein